MNRKTDTGTAGGIDVRVGLDFHRTIDYDRKAMRAALGRGASEVRKAARRIVSRRAISLAGEFPGMQTGKLKRAIGIVSRGSKGGWVKIGVRSIPSNDFYPAFLFYGSPKTGLKKRGNFMVAALSEKREAIRSIARNALKNALVPRK